MATTVDTLLVRIESDMSGIKRDLKRLETQTSQTSKSVKRSFAGVGTAIKSAIGVVLVQQLARGTIALANFSSDIEEMQAMSEAVFGQFVGTVRDQLGEFADSVGRSSFELEKMAASVQDTFVPMGYARDEAAKLSVNLTKLAVDVGSFKNVSEQMTMESFTSALVGNHETVRKFGIVIDEAGIKQELFRMGITKAYKEVDVATKVQARYNLIVAGTTDAQGDALKTADSYANLSRKLNAELGYLAADIGMALLPNMKELLKFTIDVTESFRQMVKVFGVGLTLDEELFKTGQQMAVLEEKMASLLRIATNSKNLDVARTAAMREMAIVEQQLAELRAKAVDLANKKFGLDKKATEAANDNVEANKQVNLTLSDTEKFLKNITESTEILTLERDKASALTILQKEAEHQLGKEYSENKTKINEAIEANHNLLVSMEKLKEEEDRRAALQTEGQAKLDNLIKKEAMLTAELDGQTEAQLAQLEAALEMGNLEDGLTKKILKQIEANAKLQSSVNALKKAEDARNATVEKGVDFVSEFTEVEDALKETQLGLNEAFAEGKINADEYQMATNKIGLEMKRLDPMFASTEAAARKAGDAVANVLAEAVVKGKLDADALKNIFANLVQELIAEAIKTFIIKKIMAMVFGGFGGGGSVGSGSSSMQFTSASDSFASGGAIRRRAGGGPVLVGERGPELFIPHSGGVIRNNHDTKNLMSGGAPVNIYQTIQVDTGVSQTVKTEMMNMLPRFKAETMQAVIDGKRRGKAISKVFA